MRPRLPAPRPRAPARAARAPRAARLAPAPCARSAACAPLRRYTLADGGVVRAWLYLWHGHSRAVVFDVDGTITLNPTPNPEPEPP